MKTRIYTVINALLLTVVMMAAVGCVRQTHTGTPAYSAGPSVSRFMRGESAPAEFKGSGNITVSQNRVRSSGRIDVRAKPGGFLRMDIYSPFGTAVASVEADDFNGRFISGAQTHDFTYDSMMTNVPFPCARSFTYGEFVRIITGGTPEILRQLPERPDTAVYGKKEVTALWMTETMAAWVKTSLRTGELESVKFEYGGAGGVIIVRLSRFKNGVAREISISDWDENYITIKYDTVR